MLVMVMQRCSWNDDDDVTMVMIMVTKKGDWSLGNWLPTRCIWGGIINPHCYRFRFRYHVFIYSFRCCLRRYFWTVVIRDNARASIVCGSGDEEWRGAVLWRVASAESLSVNSGCFTLVRAIQRPLPDDVISTGRGGHF